MAWWTEKDALKEQIRLLRKEIKAKDEQIAEMQLLIDKANEKLKVHFSEVVSGWVSVKDNVPSDSITVILCHKNKTVTLGHRYNHQWYIENNRVENITHWMLLPEKPNV